MILIDTDILIDAARNVNEAVTCLQQVEQQQFPAAVSSVTQMELISKNQRDYRFIEALRLLPYP